MATDLPNRRNTIDLENEKFALNDNGELVVRTEDERTAEAIENLATGSVQANLAQAEIAGQTISAVRVVKLNGAQKLIYSTNDGSFSDAQALGLSRHAGVLDDSVEVVTFGPFADSSITFALNDDVFLGSNGQLTNTAPLTGVYVKLGKMIKDNTMFIDIEQPIIL